MSVFSRVIARVTARVIAIGAMRDGLGLAWSDIAAELGQSKASVFELYQARRKERQVREGVLSALGEMKTQGVEFPNDAPAPKEATRGA